MTTTEDQRNALLSRADTYHADSRRFAEAAAGHAPPILGAPEDRRWAAAYQVIAAELRAAASGDEPSPAVQAARAYAATRPALPRREGDTTIARLSPDCEVINDASNCTVLAVPGYRVTVTSIAAAVAALTAARSRAAERDLAAEQARRQAHADRLASEHEADRAAASGDGRGLDPELAALVCEVLAEAPPEGFTVETVRARAATGRWPMTEYRRALRVLEARGSASRLIAQPGGLRWALRGHPFPVVPPGEVDAEVAADVRRLTRDPETPAQREAFRRTARRRQP
jgi:hypothetical protein